MSDEEALVEAGPTSIIRAIDGDDTLNADAMAMACAKALTTVQKFQTLNKKIATTPD